MTDPTIAAAEAIAAPAAAPTTVATPENTLPNEGATTQGATTEAPTTGLAGTPDTSGDSSSTETASTGLGAPDAKPGTEGAPETYENFTLPEGSELDAGLVTVFGDAAKAANLPQAQAQTLIDSIGPGIQKAGEEMIVSNREDWWGQVQADKELGKGGKLAENLAAAKEAYAQVAPPEVRAILEASGLDHHPGFIKMFLGIRRSSREDSFLGQDTSASAGSVDFTTGDALADQDALAEVMFKSSLGQ